MFTGLIQEVGSIVKVEVASRTKYLYIYAGSLHNELSAGDSVSCNGVCLTVREQLKDSFVCDVSEHTLKTSNLSFLKVHDIVNLESSLKMGDKIGGHLVYGHVDTMVRIRQILKKGNCYEFVFSLPQEYRKFVFPTASVALDGISLTVSECRADSFSVSIIPHTFQNTNLSRRRVQNQVNVEFDYIVKSLWAISEKRKSYF